MLIPCTRLQAHFIEPGIRLDLRAQTPMVWDEHGGTFVLRVSDLKMAEMPPCSGESCCCLEISLSSQEGLIGALEEFAGQHQLPLAPSSAPDLEEATLLAACHLPEKNLFVFAEEPTLTAVRQGDIVTLSVTGSFKARRVPCQETDLVIHLTKTAMTRLVSFVFNEARTVNP